MGTAGDTANIRGHRDALDITEEILSFLRDIE
jgi:hypothetical protein